MESPLIGPKDSNIFPEELPSFKEITEHYFNVMHSLGVKLSKFIALALEVPESFFDEYFIQVMTTYILLFMN